MTFSTATDSTITFNDGRDNTLLYSSIDKMHVKRGQKTKVVTGALIGIMTGASIGLALGSGHEDDIGGAPFIFATAGAGLGLIAGSLVGLAIKTDRWKEVLLQELRLSTSVNGGAVGLGLTLKF
jgi:hypothetical protein